MTQIHDPIMSQPYQRSGVGNEGAYPQINPIHDAPPAHVIEVVDPSDFGRFNNEDMFKEGDPDYLKTFTAWFNFGASLGRAFFLTIVMPISILFSPFVGMFTGFVEWGRIWLAPVYAYMSLVGSTVEHIFEIIYAKRAANDLARYQLGVLKAKVATGELPAAGAPLALAM